MNLSRSRSSRCYLIWVGLLELILSGVLATNGWAQEPTAPASDSPAAPAKAEELLPKFAQLPVPATEDLLRGKPSDWIVLLNDDVLMVEPVSPRPGTLEHLKAQYDALQKIPTSQVSLDEKLDRLAQLQRLPVTLQDDSPDPEYTIEVRFISRIVYFEDNIVRRVTLLLDQKDFEPAFELLMLLHRRQANWPGYADLYHRYLFMEATRLVDAGHADEALLLGQRLHTQRPDYPELSRLLGRILDGVVTSALSRDDAREARFFLTRVGGFVSDLPEIPKWTEDLRRRAASTLEQSRQAAAAGQFREATLLADRAAVIWPALPGLKDAHRELTGRYQILRVGVVADGEGSGNYPFATVTQDRRNRLCGIPLFEVVRVQDGTARYQSRYIDSWEPRELGRTIEFRMSGTRADWESRPRLTSGDILAALETRLTPGSPSYDPRWERDVGSLTASSPFDWTLRLSRIPLRVEARLRIDIPAISEGRPEQESLPGLASTARFSPVAGENNAPSPAIDIRNVRDPVRFLRSRPEKTGATGWHVAEIFERPYPSWEASLQALLRGDVDLLPNIDERDLPLLAADSRFFVMPYALPHTHVLQFHPDSPVASNASLRRALLHALDRPQLLRDVVLQGASSSQGRLITAPFATRLAAYNPQLRQPDVDPLRAASLVATARRQQQGKLPTLRLTVPGDPTSTRVVPQLVASWKRVGLDVVVVPASDTGPWDIAYRVVQFAEPFDDLWKLLHPNDRADWDQFAVYPHWLRERLGELERTVDWATAQRLLHQIQAEFLTEARWIPLWEVDQSLVARKRMSGMSTQPMHTYQDIERWSLQSWYSTELP